MMMTKDKKLKVKVQTLDMVPLRLFLVNHLLRSAQVWHMFSRDLTVFPAQHTYTFIRNRNEPYLFLPSQLWLVMMLLVMTRALPGPKNPFCDFQYEL